MMEYSNLKSILRKPTNWQLEPTDTERMNRKDVTFKIEEQPGLSKKAIEKTKKLTSYSSLTLHIHDATIQAEF